jgi:PAS domain S-box-containing protein
VSAFFSGAALVTHLVFTPLPGLGPRAFEYAVFPVVVAAAVTGGPAAISLATLAASAVAIWHTVRGGGPFAALDVHRSLVLLQMYVGVLSGTALLLAAAIAERQSAESRERAAAAVLRHRDEMLQLAQRVGGVATFEWNFTRQEAHCSAEFFRLFGMTPQEGVMSTAERGGFLHPANREHRAVHLARALEGREPANADYRIVLRDASVRWLSYAGQLQETSDVLRMLGSVLDITDRKRAEAALQDAKIAAESANQLKDQFLATLSHELRTPLNAILGYARMLRTNVIAPENRERAVEVIERNAVAQIRLIEDLLDVSRITTGQIRLEPQPVTAAVILREALDGVRPAAEAKRIVLDVEDDDGACLVDTGSGIAADFLPFVFEPFRQADGRLARGHGGLGLGLAISKQLVELHGGTIRAASDGPGAGATFVIRLPRRDGADPAAPPLHAGSSVQT